MTTNRLDYARLQAAMKRQGYPFYDTGDYNLNIIGIRTDDQRSNLFNDWIVLAFRQNDHEQLLAFQATTDPGLHWLQNPMVETGTAILRPGHYRSLFTIGKHQGKYEALTQHSAVTVYRDNNRDAIMDTGDDVPVDYGHFGINLHRASPDGESRQVDRWSAGCQVIANSHDFDLLMAVARRAAEDWGPVFSYTLLPEHNLWS